MITIEMVKNFIWMVFITWWIWEFGLIAKVFGFKIIAVVIQGISAVLLLADGIISVPIVHWLIFEYWR